MAYGCAVDSGLGRYEFQQEALAREYDAQVEVMRPIVAFFNGLKKAIALLPLVDSDKERMFEYVACALQESDFIQDNPEINLGEHIDGYNQAMGYN